MMKILNNEQFREIVGGAVAVGSAKTNAGNFDWGEFGLVSAGLAVLGGLAGALYSTTSNPNNTRASRGDSVGSIVGGALLIGSLGAAGDAAHQLAFSEHHTTF